MEAKSILAVAPVEDKEADPAFLKGLSRGTSSNPPKVSWRQTFRAICIMGKPYFCDPKSRLTAWLLLVAVLVFMYFEVTTFVHMAAIMKEVQDAVVAKNQEEMINRCWSAFWTVAKLLPILLLHIGASSILSQSWRKFLTERVFEMYASNDQGFYKLKLLYGNIDNPDQRIAQDIGSFTHHSLALITHLMRDLLKVIENSKALMLISPKLFYMLVGFSTCYFIVSILCFAAPLMRLERRILAVEADLRYLLMRLRENAESIAFFGGADFERQGCSTCLDKVIWVHYKKIAVQSLLQVLGTLIGFVAHFMPLLIVAPMYFHGETTFGTISQSQALFQHLMSGMLDFGKEIGNIAGVGAQSVRVQELWDALLEMESTRLVKYSGQMLADDASTEPGDSSSEADSEDGIQEKTDVVSLRDLDLQDSLRVKVDSVTLLPPFGESPLVYDLSFELRSGESLLVSGPSGAGKSSLLRAIGGLWARGSGHILRIPRERSFFLPQTPYICLGGLRANVLYPREDDGTISDERVLQALRDLQMEHLAERFGLVEEIAFDSILSGGERQRLNIVRLLLQENVEFALLDEATSALDETNEKIVYKLIRKSIPCYISVGHRPELELCHNKKLQLERIPQGGCRGTLIALTSQLARTPSVLPGTGSLWQPRSTHSDVYYSKSQ